VELGLLTDAVFLGKPVWVWLGFLALVVVLLVLDLGILHKKTHEIEVKESLILSAGYITAGLLFSGVIYWLYYTNAPVSDLDPRLMTDDAGARALLAMELYLTGFVVEKTLALDNIFVISLIFTYFAIPRLYQHRVLFWGILGVIVLRGLMIGLGAALVKEFAWILYVFGAFLVVTGIKMLVMADKEMNIADNPVLKFMRKKFRVTDTLHGEAFVVKEKDPKTGKMVRAITPLMMALVLIEIADVIFAVDSVPAIFAITQDPYIVYTSNIFAILGLRALYFALAAMMHRFTYLKYALSAVLVFIGGKIFFVGIIGKVPASISLSVTLGIIAAGIGYSLWKTRKDGQDAAPVPAETRS